MKNKRDDSLKVATATGKKIVWERKKIHIFCCRNAFSPTHGCNFAFCQRCHITKLEDGENGGLFGKRVGDLRVLSTVEIQEQQQKFKIKPLRRVDWIVVSTV